MAGSVKAKPPDSLYRLSDKIHEQIAVRAQPDIVNVRQVVRGWCLSVGMGLVDLTKMVTAASEIARNTVEYGGGGTYTEIDPPRRLAFTWLWDDNSTRMLIELDFEETGGVTTVRFTHRGLWDEDAVRSHEGGWTTAFDNLERALGTRRAG